MAASDSECNKTEWNHNWDGIFGVAEHVAQIFMMKFIHPSTHCFNSDTPHTKVRCLRCDMLNRPKSFLRHKNEKQNIKRFIQCNSHYQDFSELHCLCCVMHDSWKQYAQEAKHSQKWLQFVVSNGFISCNLQVTRCKQLIMAFPCWNHFEPGKNGSSRDE